MSVIGQNRTSYHSTMYNQNLFPLDALYGPWDSWEEFLNEFDITKDEIPCGLTISIREDGEVVEYWRENEGGDIIKKEIYKSAAEDYWKTCEVGGVKKDTTPENFKGKTISQVFDEILYPTLPPDIKYPSCELSYTGDKLIEVGVRLPSESDFTTTWNRGSVSYVNVNGDFYYAGEKKSDELVMNPDKFNQTSEEGVYFVVYNIIFKDGSELWDNKRNLVDEKYVSETCSSNSICIKSVYPIYINTERIENVSKQPVKDYLVDGGCSFEVEIPNESRDNKLEFHIPEHLTIKSIGQYNPVDNDYTGHVDYVQNGTTSYNGKVYKIYVRTLDVESMVGKAKYKITIIK